MFRITDANKKWWGLVALGLNSGLLLFDETVLGTALPTIRDDLGISGSTAHWVLSAYLLAFASCAAIGGKISDVIGVRAVIVAGRVVLIVASLIAATAESALVLIAARGLQGVSAGFLFPISSPTVAALFPPEHRGRAIGYLSIFSLSFLAAGPLVGGAFADFIGWRWIFAINIPIICAVIVVSMLALTDLPATRPISRFDYVGVLPLVGGAGLLVFGLMEVPDKDIATGAAVAAIVLGIMVLAYFLYFETRQPEPLVHVHLLRIPAVRASTLSMLSGQLNKITVAVFIALFLQDEVGLSPTNAGVITFAAVMVSPFAALPSGWIADRMGSRLPCLAGQVVASICIIAIAATMHMRLMVPMIAILIIWGAAMPFCLIPPLRLIFQSVPFDLRGEVGGIASTMRLFGGALAMAIGSAVLVSSGSHAAVFLSAGVIITAICVYSFLVFREEMVEPAPAQRETA